MAWCAELAEAPAPRPVRRRFRLEDGDGVCGGTTGDTATPVRAAPSPEPSAFTAPWAFAYKRAVPPFWLALSLPLLLLSWLWLGKSAKRTSWG